MKALGTTTYKIFVAAIASLLIASPLVNAHPGHNHDHWMSDGLHLSILLAIATGISLSIYCFQKSRKIQSSYISVQEKG